MKTRVFTAVAGVLAIAGAAVFAKPGDVQDKVKDPSTAPAKAEKEGQPVSPLDFKLKTIDGKDLDLSQYKGKVVMLVNVASKCGLTKQYAGLQALYDKYKDQGLVVVGFPANNFKGQEPDTNEKIKEFCSSKYNVTFPLMSKISVAGDDKHPLYKFLTEEQTAKDFSGDIGWNFTKFLVDRSGKVVKRYAPQTKPEDIARDIEAVLG